MLRIMRASPSKSGGTYLCYRFTLHVNLYRMVTAMVQKVVIKNASCLPVILPVPLFRLSPTERLAIIILLESWEIQTLALCQVKPNLVSYLYL